MEHRVFHIRKSAAVGLKAWVHVTHLPLRHQLYEPLLDFILIFQLMENRFIFLVISQLARVEIGNIELTRTGISAPFIVIVSVFQNFPEFVPSWSVPTVKQYLFHLLKPVLSIFYKAR